MLRQKCGHPANLHGMEHNVIHHLHFAHQQKALFLGWNSHEGNIVLILIFQHFTHFFSSQKHEIRNTRVVLDRAFLPDCQANFPQPSWARKPEVRKNPLTARYRE